MSSGLPVHVAALNAIQNAVPVIMHELHWDRDAIVHYVDCVILMEERRLAARPHADALAEMEEIVADYFTMAAVAQTPQVEEGK